jgi:hypothetical protein
LGTAESIDDAFSDEEEAILLANFEFGTKTVGRAETDSERAMIVTIDDTMLRVATMVWSSMRFRAGLMRRARSSRCEENERGPAKR